MEFHMINMICGIAYAHTNRKDDIFMQTRLYIDSIFGNWGQWGGWALGGYRIYCSTNIIQEIEGSVEHTWAEAYWSTFGVLVWFWISGSEICFGSKTKGLSFYSYVTNPPMKVHISVLNRYFETSCHKNPFIWSSKCFWIKKIVS